MNNVRLWVVLLGLTCFLAGLSCGLFVSWRGREPQRSSEPFADTREAFTARFALDERRTALFQELLRAYHDDLERARAGVLARSRTELEPALEQIALRYQSAIRDHVLPPERRAEFDRLAAEWKTIQ